LESEGVAFWDGRFGLHSGIYGASLPVGSLDEARWRLSPLPLGRARRPCDWPAVTY